jgi:hypothetical protein
LVSHWLLEAEINKKAQRPKAEHARQKKKEDRATGLGVE